MINPKYKYKKREHYTVFRTALYNIAITTIISIVPPITIHDAEIMEYCTRCCGLDCKVNTAV